TERTTMRLNCNDLGGAKSCMKEAAGHTRTAMHSCRTDATKCRSCCGNGGTSDTCSPICDGTPMQSTWNGIHRRLLQRPGRTPAACHGSANQGGLDLSENAYKNLVEVQSPAFSMVRVEPGDERRSLLWLKLAAGTDPSLLPAGVNVGTPMPNGGLAPL